MGNELLAEFRQNQEYYTLENIDVSDPEFGIFRIPSTLSGNYQVVRRDQSIISIKYIIDRYYTGAAHGGRTTRVQNFRVRPFSPITLETLLGDESNFPRFATFIRKKLEETISYDRSWLESGTEPKTENFERFNIDNNGILFVFAEYKIDCYAAGEQTLWVSFHELKDVCGQKIIAVLENNGL